MELAVATIGTEQRVGIDSAEAKCFREEVSRRAAEDGTVSAYVNRARRFAVLIAEGFGMDFFRDDEFTRADRQLALALGAERTWPRFSSGSINVFRKH